MQFDSVRIGVSDLTAAASAYEFLLGSHARMVKDVPRFQLARGAVELSLGEPGLESLCFAGTTEELASWNKKADGFHGVRVRVLPARDVESAHGETAIDHIVVHSPDLDRARALWRDQLGLRLALQREFPKRGLHMLFFRSGGVTLEFVGTLPPGDRGGPDRLWGIAYRVADLHACRSRLLQAGLDVSEIRAGHKPGTQVATVRSGTEGIPTLLIEATSSHS